MFAGTGEDDHSRIEVVDHPRGNRGETFNRPALLTRPGAVQVLTLQASGGLEAEHVYVVGLQAAVAVAAPEHVPDVLLGESLPPDNDVTREMDEKRMAWAIGDLIENRPALSRWHPDWADRFAEYMKG